jgi:hypothetical protein
MGINSFVRVPPDSTGKRLFAQEHTVGGQAVQVQALHLVDHTNPEHAQRVDVRGQALVRFAEGSPTIDAFNNLRVGEGTILGGYEFSNGDMADLFQDVTTGSGSVTYVPAASHTVHAVGALAGDSVKRTTNRYHYYQPGVSQLVLMTLAHGDAGKAGNVRRWGYYDDSDGVFFELNGTTLNVVLRSSVTGSVVEIRVPQSQWNGDRLDGTGMSGMTIDVTKANFWGLDLAWLGVGVVRMGVWAPDGSRWVAHVFENPNNRIGAYMRRGSLPLRYENFNTAGTAGTSEMKQICAAVYSQARTDYTFWRFSDIERLTPVAVTTDTPILSMRVKAGSRVGIYPEAVNLLVQGGAVKFTIVDDATLTGATWAVVGGGDAQGDVAATAVAGGEPFYSFFVAEGVSHKELHDYYELNDEGYHRLADDSDSYTFTLLATKLTGTTVTVAATLNYKELR